MDQYNCYKTDFLVGITERGDAGLDFSWTEGIHAVEYAVIISKCANKKLEDALLKYKDKVIYHATCTGLGGTLLEPNVPSIKDKFIHIKNLLFKGFPADQVVIRIDPIFPKIWEEKLNKNLNINYLNNLREILYLAESLGIKRIRYSFLDCYKHVLKRLETVNKNFIFDEPWNLCYKNEFRLDKINKNFEFETCCEHDVPPWHKTGCISKKDLEILKRKDLKFTGHSKQRMLCLCPGNKFELLDHRHPCTNNCTYCYWKDNR
jgi:hypothetical protein